MSSQKTREEAALRLKSALQKVGADVKLLAQVLGVTTSSAYRLLAGQGGIGLEDLAAIARELRIAPTWVVLGQGPMLLAGEAGRTPELSQELQESVQEVRKAAQVLERAADDIRKRAALNQTQQLLEAILEIAPTMEGRVRGYLEARLEEAERVSP